MFIQTSWRLGFVYCPLQFVKYAYITLTYTLTEINAKIMILFANNKLKQILIELNVFCSSPPLSTKPDYQEPLLFWLPKQRVMTSRQSSMPSCALRA